MTPITKSDVRLFTFGRYTKRVATQISDEILPTGTVVDTLEGLYTCKEPSRLAIDVSGNVYPIAESVFTESYLRLS